MKKMMIILPSDFVPVDEVWVAYDPAFNKPVVFSGYDVRVLSPGMTFKKIAHNVGLMHQEPLPTLLKAETATPEPVTKTETPEDYRGGKER